MMYIIGLFFLMTLIISLVLFFFLILNKLILKQITSRQTHEVFQRINIFFVFRYKHRGIKPLAIALRLKKEKIK